MKLNSVFRTIVCATLFTMAFASATVAQDAPAVESAPPVGFVSLFNGTDLTGWYAIKTESAAVFNAMSKEDQEAAITAARKTTGEHWRVENGEIANDGQGPYLTSEQTFGDYEIMAQFKTMTEGDREFGQWNQLKIKCVGSVVSGHFNGMPMVDQSVKGNRYWVKQSELPGINRAPIQIQTNGDKMRLRNIFVREIPAEEANELLRSKNNEGFEAIVKGDTFDGWSGPLENYEINDGVIKCKPEKGGTIFTKKVYSDFVVRLDFRLPPAGNNGLAIRYPGEGDTAYVGMCELQVLDSEHEKYRSLDARQYHGSAYGIKAAQRGFLRETGQWNFQEVTVKGSTIKVELNGNVILDCDLNDVTEYHRDKPHPGKTNTSGHFGLAGHNDPVEYRNLEIKVLN